MQKLQVATRTEAVLFALRAQLFGENVHVKSERGKGTKVVEYVLIK